jgi:Holliday junction resolvase RusA-like endonuclease
LKKDGIYTGRAVVVDAGGEKTKVWRQAVAAEAMQAMKGQELAPLTTPIEIELLFRIQRPKAHFLSDGISLRPAAPRYHMIRPDCTKLARSTEDAMTGKCYVDDAQIVKQSHEKAFSEIPGCWVIIREAGK